MAKLQKPLNKTELWITQTYHGEKTKLPDTQCAVDISANVGNEVMSVVDGVIEKVDVAGEYVSIIPDGGNFRILNVHINLIPVKMGQRVRVGQVIGHIAPNKGGSHLHFGLKWKNPAKPAPCPMDYFDRSIVFRTKYQDIKKEWFIGENINWALFKDLSYNNINMSYKVGDKIVFTGVQNIRKGSGTSYPITGSTKIGEIYEIEDGPRTSDGYTWYDLKNNNWVADVGKFKLFIEEESPVDCQKEIDRLLEVNRGLSVALGASEDLLKVRDGQLSEARGTIKLLEANIEEAKNDYANMEESYAKVLEAKERIEQEKLAAQEELDRLKQSSDWVKRIAELLSNLFNRK